ncbi:TonB-dependent receptor-like protein [Geothermobacter ehrlichii]|uniref:TonB-dependent receptor-like protein n=1 Tax=Geothermobacter ehrlichii TaxID=213224 RepID=A0A5D3WKR9_9BACT|nr:TonB-dependent receptor [Geothermobacter ehrlichii]TYO98801.1 TonB-dependent receptor-like protein [Geothermobacter ehrlichii]
MSHSNLLRILSAFFGLLAICLPSAAVAADREETVLPPVTIVDRLDISAGGVSLLRRPVLDRLPAGNGTLTEMLDVLPDVQFSESFRSGRTGGEILPPDISISGGKVFQNAFTLDGIDNAGILDPMARNPNSLTDVPGHPQQLFVDAALVDEIAVYDSNIPARFGGFTGGVVDARLRMPGQTPSARLSWRHTRDDWARFHLAGEEHFDFFHSSSASRQPRFRKDFFGAGFDLPVGAKTGLLFEARVARSEIPLFHLDRQEIQRRSSVNFLARVTRESGTDDLYDISLLYAPYRASHFLTDVENSAFSVSRGGFRLAGGYHHFRDDGESHLQLFFRGSENQRSAPAHFRNWLASASKPWGSVVESDYSREGGFGDVEQGQQSIGLNWDVTYEPPSRGRLVQEFGAGLQWQVHRGTYDRSETSFIFKDAVLAPDVICTDDLLGCIEEEQYFSRRDILRANSEAVHMQELAFYVDDSLTLDRLQVRPGLRLSWNSYLQNLDLAPRLAASWDLRGDRTTMLTLGVNRYYGRSFLAFKLREARLPVISQYRPKRNSAVGSGSVDPGAVVDPADPGLWELYPAGLQSVARFSDLDTPYSDEIVFGLDQELYGGRLSMKLVQRQGRDEFARQFGPVLDDGLRYYTMNNRGRSRHRSLRLSWERSWRKQYLMLSWVWQENLTSNETYDVLLDDEEIEPRVWYRGRIVYRSELPRTDYSRPHVVRLLHMMALPGGMHLTTRAQYLAAYRSLENTYREVPVPGSLQRFDAIKGEFVQESLFVYDEVRHEQAVQVDLRLAWNGRLAGLPAVDCHLDILNLFDSTIESGTTPGDYRLGRQFWVGFDLRF